jgi:NAD(P)-dependent dehydrogenase (short-subunit alcohol dehydrogenase family)
VKAAAVEGAARGLAFNVVCPGFVLSPLTSGLGEARLERERARDTVAHWAVSRRAPLLWRGS